MKLNEVIHGDCLKVMKGLDSGSVDLILCDLPYGATANKWDSIIPLSTLWDNYKRIAKPDAAIVLFCSQPFTAMLGASNLPWLRYSLVWHKSRATGHLNAKKIPMKNHEDILVFYASSPVYNPQGLKPFGRLVKRGHNGGNFRASGTENFQENTGYPRSVLSFPSEGKTRHPTQKPVALLEYLVRTFSNPGDLVLDNCAGSGSTGVACINADRKFLLIEKDKEYCQIASDRIKKARAGLRLGVA